MRIIDYNEEEQYLVPGYALRFLVVAVLRLYREDRMNGDAQRDMAQSLQSVLNATMPLADLLTPLRDECVREAALGDCGCCRAAWKSAAVLIMDAMGIDTPSSEMRKALADEMNAIWEEERKKSHG